MKRRVDGEMGRVKGIGRIEGKHWAGGGMCMIGGWQWKLDL